MLLEQHIVEKSSTFITSPVAISLYQITQELREKINQLNLMMEQVNGDYQVRFGMNTFDRFFYEPSTSLDKKPLEVKLNSQKSLAHLHG